MNIHRLLVPTFASFTIICSACAPLNQQHGVVIPSLPRVEPVAVAPPPTPHSGAIFAMTNHRPLFENRRARMVGDVLSIQISEKTSASKKSNSSIDRQGSAEGSLLALPFMKESTLGKFGIGGSSSNKFDGKGATDSNNDFTGQITVSVVQVMSNGNLVVSGEKQVGLNGNVDVLRFNGVVNPSTILPDNSVLSSKVADVRLDFSGRGAIKESQGMGWLSRFFMNFLPI